MPGLASPGAESQGSDTELFQDLKKDKDAKGANDSKVCGRGYISVTYPNGQCAATISHCKEIRVLGVGGRLETVFCSVWMGAGSAGPFMDRYGKFMHLWQDEFANFLDEIKELDAGH